VHRPCSRPSLPQEICRFLRYTFSFDLAGAAGRRASAYPYRAGSRARSRAVITWKATDGPETSTRTVASEHQTLALLGSIEHDMDVALVSAGLIQS
jgi:hypothetical protein